MNGIKILGTGSYFPPRILTNADLEKMVNTTDEWITSRTGIKERHIAADNVATSDLAIEAALAAITDAQVGLDEIDVIIVATITQDMSFPSTACTVQNGLKIKNCACFDIAAACTGFIYALAVGRGLIMSGLHKTALIIGADTLSKITDWTDRNTCVLFGDGAGAMVIRASDANATEDDVLSLYLNADGSYGNILNLPGGGSRTPLTKDNIGQGLQYLHMEGKEVFKVATMKMVEAAKVAVEQSGKQFSDLALVIPHQANMRIIEAVGERLDVPKEKIYVNLDRFGNISAASNISALDEAKKKGLIKHGDLVELVAFGGGLTWGAAVIRI
jgi:3-oxoacyl-[acyl-carrier-protein] synthase-3